MPVYDWFRLALAAVGLAVAGTAAVTAVRGLARREYGSAVLFLLLGAGFAAAGLYTGYLAASGASL
jgi:hypothetical protein